MRAFPIPLLILSFFVLQLIGCNCKNKSTTCPALNSTYQSYLSVEIGDTITYRNNLGVKTNFTVKEKHISESTETPCHNGQYSCNCPKCETQGGYGAFTNDTIWTKYDTIDNKDKNYGRIYYTITQSKDNEQDFSNLYFTGLEFDFKIPVSAENLESNQRIISDTILGSHQYKNIIVCTVDTSSSWPPHKNSFYTKLYFKPEIGLIGFHHTKLNSTFYLP